MGEETGSSRDHPSPQEASTAGHFVRPAALLLAVPNQLVAARPRGDRAGSPPCVGFPSRCAVPAPGPLLARVSQISAVNGVPVKISSGRVLPF